MQLTKGAKIVLSVIAALFLAFVIYGLATDCPHTSGYFFCSESEREFLHP